MSAAVDRLQADVTDMTTVVESAKLLIAGLAQQIRDNATDPAALNAIADQLEATKADLAGAVTANTVAEAGEPAAPADAGGTADPRTGDGTGTGTGDGTVTDPPADPNA